MRGSGRKVRPHFRHWSREGTGRKMFPTFGEALARREATRSESPRHRKAKRVCAEALTELIKNGSRLPWAFRNPEISDFPMTGDLLSGVSEVREEYSIDTPFGEKYRFDVALVASGGSFKKPVILGAIEFEFESRLSIWKTAVCKAAGIPIVSIDLDEVGEEMITREWIVRTLLETAASSEDGRRRNFIFVHSMLYPVFLDVPAKLRLGPDRHQYVVFAPNETLGQLKTRIEQLRERLGLREQEALVQPNRATSEQARRMMRHEGSMAGHDWAKYNPDRYLRISLDVPRRKQGALYLFHAVLARLLCSADCLVGYKFEMGANNWDSEEPMWKVKKWNEQKGVEKEFKIAPKHLSQPLRPLLRFLAAVQADKKSAEA